MVPPQNEEILGILDLVRQEQTDRLEALLASIHIVAEEEVIGFGRESAVLEQTQQIVVLPVDVAADLDRSFEFEQDRLVDEDLARPRAQVSDLVLGQLHGFTGSVASHCVQISIVMI